MLGRNIKILQFDIALKVVGNLLIIPVEKNIAIKSTIMLR
jgi:hypothetical protein